ncbi:lipase family protein [Nocardioides sp. GY 10127]|uniref:lipase family protein n=1 Tax=Nocardioides sp. GY 10127 TaxID=2569762 RepID=UPI001458212A|nr:lipase family protein [Nocardioides sp. GY 10127]
MAHPSRRPRRRRPRAVGASLLAASLALTALVSSGPLGSFTASADGTVPPTDATAVPLPSHDPFYRYQGETPLREVPRGTILAQRAVTLSAFGVVGTPVEAEQLLYRTQDQRRRPSVGVTTVLTPSAPATATVAYLSFYDALGDQCSPSYTLRGGDAGTDSANQTAQIEEGLVAELLAQGYAVTVPDFEGVHQHWVAGQESGWSTLDSVRATSTFLAADPLTTPLTDQVGLYGYSGGSIAGEWAAELAPRYAPEIDLAGAALGGLPVHLAHNLEYVNGSEDWSGVIPAVLVSLGRAFGVPMRKYESAYGRRVHREVHDQCIGSFNGNYPGLTVQQLLKPRYADFLGVPVFARIVNRLIMGSTPGDPETPMMLAVGDHDGTGDDVMVVADVGALAREYCDAGLEVRYRVYASSDHSQAGLQFFEQGMEFLAERFAGLPVADSCVGVPEGGSLDPVPVERG